MHRRGEVSSPRRVGGPNAYGFKGVRQYHIALLWSAGVGRVARCYRHIAPLERKAPMHQNSRDGIHRRGEVSSPSGLGQPTPTGSMSVCDNTILRSSGARGLDAGIGCVALL